jgi:hypothetical protein
MVVGLLPATLVGMAYIVARPNGRFEIRESVHTPKGPRARSLVNFDRFTEEILERARARASRPFDSASVRDAAMRATTATDPAGDLTPADTASTIPRHEQPENRRFVEASRRMVQSLERLPDSARRRDPGAVLIDLFEFVANVSSSPPTGPPKPLRFPPLARLRATRGAPASE